MRDLLTLAGTLLTFTGLAQNWALLNPAYKYNYSNDGTDTISNQVFIKGTEVLGSDSVRYAFNNIAVVTAQCGGALQIDVPQFLMRGCAVHNDIWEFNDTASYVLHPLGSPGESWLFQPSTGSTATIVSAELNSVLGITDSVKTLVTDAGDEIIWSKSFGIIRWHLAGNSPMEQIGVHGPDLGTLIPTLNDLYPYQAGDVFAFTEGAGHNQIYWHQTISITVTSRTDYTDSIYFDGPTHWAYWINSYPSTHGTGYGLWASRSRFEMLDAALSYPGQYLVPDSTFPSWYDGGAASMVAEHGLDENGFYRIRSKIFNPGQPWQISLLASDFMSGASCVDIMGYDENELIISAQVGLRRRQMAQVNDGDAFEWLGSVISGDTLGYIPVLNVGIEDVDPRPHLSIFPNPASDQLILTPALPGRGISIVDLNGRTVAADAIGSVGDRIDVHQLEPGAYLLMIEGFAPKRFIIAR
ncbi:MAG: T9SS type A sorting domain-containing protein [Flavobacteriales bacterium]